MEYLLTVVKDSCDNKLFVVILDAPGEPRDLAIDKFDRTSVTLKWKKPNDDGGNPIKGIWLSGKTSPSS